MRQKGCCFIGLPPYKLPYGFEEDHPDCVVLKQKLMDILEHKIRECFTSFFTGMEMGPDLWCAEILLALKGVYSENGLALNAILSSEEQANGWPKEYHERFYAVLSQVDDARFISAHKEDHCVEMRDRSMFKQCSFAVAVLPDAQDAMLQTALHAGLDVLLIEADTLQQQLLKPPLTIVG